MIATASLAAFSSPVRTGADDAPPLSMRPSAKPQPSTPPTAPPSPEPALLRLASQTPRPAAPVTSPARPFQAHLPRGSALNLHV
ncbi:MAG: hypothetical protein ACP5M1_03685 [Acidiphilium sp.]